MSVSSWKPRERKKEKNSQSYPQEPAKAALVKSDSRGDVLFATFTEKEVFLIELSYVSS